MKKFLKVLAATAAVASIIPLRNKITEDSGSLEALLWKATWTVDPDYQSEPDVHITVGFNNIFRPEDKENELFADDLVVDYCCDETLAQNGETRVYTEEDVAEADTEEPACNCEETTGCDCGGDCGCEG